MVRYLKARNRAINESYNAQRHSQPAFKLSVAEPEVPNLREYTAEADFVRALPEVLRLNAQPPRTVVAIGAANKQFDYISDKLVLELKVAPYDIRHLAADRLNSALLQLAVARKATEATHPGRAYTLAVVVNKAPGIAIPQKHALQRLSLDASLLGLDILTVDDAADVALYVAAVESGALRHLGDPDLDMPGEPPQ